MTRKWGQLGVLAGLLAPVGCGQDAEATGEVGQLSAFEVTTVTTVQASSGIFLSPRPQQMRPPYVERGREGATAVSEPTSDLDRAKVDSALLFRSETPWHGSLRLQATFSALAEEREPLPQHFFPALALEGADAAWPIELRAAAQPDRGAWTEWDGWLAFPGLAVGAGASDEGAPAATLDYETLGLESPLVLTSEGDDMIITNRSEQAIAQVLLVFSHADGVGIQWVSDLGPGMQRVTTTGPKEHNAERLLQEGREQLALFFRASMGPELGQAVARAKSIPFLETLGLRLIYMLDERQAPEALGLPEGLAGQRRFVICQAEVLAPSEEAQVLATLANAELRASDVSSQLGRFTRAKLEVARLIGDEQARATSSALLETLSE